MLRPTALNVLARQVVYTSLVDLSEDARKQAILDAVGVAPPSNKLEQIREALAETANPRPTLTSDDRMDAGPNRKFDEPYVDQDLVELPHRQRSLIKTILDFASLAMTEWN
jgi:hypothetical protein